MTNPFYCERSTVAEPLMHGRPLEELRAQVVAELVDPLEWLQAELAALPVSHLVAQQAPDHRREAAP